MRINNFSLSLPSRVGLKKIKAWSIFSVLSVAYVFVAFHRVNLNVISTDIMQQLTVGAVYMGLLSSIFFFIFGAMQLPSGILADTVGARKIVPTFFALSGLGCLLFWVWPGPNILICARILIGLGVSVIFICSLKVLSQWFSSETYTSVSGLFLGIGGLGLLLAGAPFAFICDLIGWQASMGAIGIFSILWSFLIFAVVKDFPKEACPGSHLTDGDGRKIGCGILENVKAIASNNQFWWVSIWFCCQYSVHMAFGGVWAGPFLTDVVGISKVDAGVVICFMGLGLMLGGPINGLLADKIVRSRKPVMITNSIGLVILLTVFLVGATQFNYFISALWFFFLGFFGMGSICLGYSTVRLLFPNTLTGTASGLINTFPSFIISLLQPVLGYLIDAGGRTEGLFTFVGFKNASSLLLTITFLGFFAAYKLKEET